MTACLLQCESQRNVFPMISRDRPNSRENTMFHSGYLKVRSIWRLWNDAFFSQTLRNSWKFHGPCYGVIYARKTRKISFNSNMQYFVACLVSVIDNTCSNAFKSFLSQWSLRLFLSAEVRHAANDSICIKMYDKTKGDQIGWNSSTDQISQRMSFYRQRQSHGKCHSREMRELGRSLIIRRITPDAHQHLALPQTELPATTPAHNTYKNTAPEIYMQNTSRFLVKEYCKNGAKQLPLENSEPVSAEFCQRRSRTTCYRWMTFVLKL